MASGYNGPRLLLKDVSKKPQGKDHAAILIHEPYYDEFLETMTKVFHWCRWSGVVGLESLRWKLWGSLLVTLLVAIEVQAIWKVVKALAGWALDVTGHRSVSARLSGAMFYAAALLGLLQCWRLSSCWPRLCSHWVAAERALGDKRAPPDTALRTRMLRIVGAVAACTVVEHVLNILSHVDFHCQPSQCLRTYILRSHGFLLLGPICTTFVCNVDEYSDWVAAPLLLMSNVATAVWSVQSLLIVLLSAGLVSRYRRLNACVARLSSRRHQHHHRQQQLHGHRRDTEFADVYSWRKIREAFVKQAQLVRLVDRRLGGLVLLATFFNFYFVCLQLFLSIARGGGGGGPLQQLQRAVSAAWLGGGAGATLLAAAAVQRHSAAALPHLYRCAAPCFNAEVERLQKQLTEDRVALSGCGFFALDRNVILKLAGAVVTYVLVLVQYDSADDDAPAP